MSTATCRRNGTEVTAGAAKITTGVDVVATDRIATLLDDCGESVVDRVFTDAEIAYSRQQACPPVHFAARWAAKEATMKALPQLSHVAAFDDIEVRHNRQGAPELRLDDRLQAELTREPAATVSLSHDRHSGVAIAQVVLLLTQSDRPEEVNG